MASLTRNRCAGTLPDEHTAAHYAARAGCGLILSEGALISPQGSEWPSAPGIWGPEHVAAWKKVTDAVHAAGGLIFCQLWHIGRVAHPLAQSGRPAPGPSAVAAAGGKFRQLAGEPGYVTPEPIADPSAYVALYGKAAANAKAAGFDGCELHAANGYLVAQFLESSSNKRTDAYGGSVANRCRFALEAVDACIAAWDGDAKRVGIKLSPSGGYNDMGEGKDGAAELYGNLIKELNAKSIGYVQVGRYLKDFDFAGRGADVDIAQFRPLCTQTLFLGNTGYSPEEAEASVASGAADGIVIGRPHITNPDYCARIFNGKALSYDFDFNTFYNVPEGQSPAFRYNDYPTVA